MSINHPDRIAVQYRHDAYRFQAVRIVIMWRPLVRAWVFTLANRRRSNRFGAPAKLGQIRTPLTDRLVGDSCGSFREQSGHFDLTAPEQLLTHLRH
jgi:hypothetical protein